MSCPKQSIPKKIKGEDFCCIGDDCIPLKDAVHLDGRMPDPPRPGSVDCDPHKDKDCVAKLPKDSARDCALGSC